jgi:hypothetical protein
MHIATATDEVEYNEVAPQLRHEFLEMPRKRLEKIIVDERDAALTQKMAQMKRPAPKRDRAPGGREQPAADAGGGGKPKVGGREGMAIKLLKRDLSEMPYIYKGTGKERKAACLFHNSGARRGFVRPCRFLSGLAIGGVTGRGKLKRRTSSKCIKNHAWRSWWWGRRGGLRAERWEGGHCYGGAVAARAGCARVVLGLGLLAGRL